MQTEKMQTNLLIQIDSFLESSFARMKRMVGIIETRSAIRHLSRLLSSAKLSRAIERIRSPRRFILTIMAVVLGMVWLGQALLGIMLRSQATTEELMSLIPLSLVVYFSWNFIKIASQKPVEPFEWTETERELLLGSPLKRREIIQYRCLTIARAALIKSAIFTFVMIPDLEMLPLGFLGILVSLICIELSRCTLEILVYGASKLELILFRCLVYGALAIVVGRALFCTVLSSDIAQQLETAASFGFLLSFFDAIKDQLVTWYGIVLLAPFQFATRLIIADKVDLDIGLRLCTCAGIVLGMQAILPRLEGFAVKRRLQLERTNFQNLKNACIPKTSTQKVVSRQSPRRIFGAGSLMWRQCQGALSYKYSLSVSLLIPSILACMPAFSGVKDFALVANTVGALAFYSMVLLPASLKFDFRRDVERLHTLKAMPISPLWLTVGQLAVPIAITTCFQVCSLLLVLMISPYNPLYLVGGIVVLLPFTVFIFCFENLAFLWYPYRLNQEGMQVLIRSILVFTAKSLVFALSFATTFVWVLVSRYVAENILPQCETSTIFAGGMFIISGFVAALVFMTLVNAFHRFDPSADLVGLD